MDALKDRNAGTSGNVAGLAGRAIKTDPRDFADSIAFDDHKIAFITRHCRGRDVLDIGCVQHDPEARKSKYWVHKAICAVSKNVLGIDLYDEGVRELANEGFNIVTADAQDFDFSRKFDVIVAGDIIEHIENFYGFLESCKRHMHPHSRLLISTPNPWYWRNWVKAALRTEVNSNPEHTCWLCPRTLRQLVNRHDLEVEEVRYGSRYLRDRLLPLPRGWKHTSFHAEIRLKHLERGDDRLPAVS